MSEGHTKIRKRSRIETELPADIREQVNRLLLEGSTYDDVAAFCQTRGHDISKSSVGRYGKTFFEAYQNIRIFEDQSRALTSEVDDGLPMEEAVGKMLLQKVLAGLVSGEADVLANSRLISDVASLQRSSISLQKHKMDLEKRVTKVADEVAAAAKFKGASDEFTEWMRKKILGLVQ